jgi:16S rRNA (adenine1518-N6/adenine1519-N6)-dimethyltransferase
MVKPKKYLGQHFLKDKNIAEKIVNALDENNCEIVLEIGPGTGILTQFLLKKNFELYVIEIDNESVSYLKENFKELAERIFAESFLDFNFVERFNKNVSVIGNFPYNISSQILFKVLEYRILIPEVVGMFQKEVAERIVSAPGSKVYGVLSVLIQAYYDVEYLFTVNETVFYPPPKVKSAVIKLKRKEIEPECNESFFRIVVKTAFNQRRKTLRNSLKSLIDTSISSESIFNLRPEQLTVNDFIGLTGMLKNNKI